MEATFIVEPVGLLIKLIVLTFKYSHYHSLNSDNLIAFTNFEQEEVANYAMPSKLRVLAESAAAKFGVKDTKVVHFDDN